jgi:O-antigen ligase
MVQAHPLFGVGPERIHDEFPNYNTGKPVDYYGHLHNNFLQIAAERGLLSLAAFVWFLVELYRSLLVRLRDSEDDTHWAILGSIARTHGIRGRRNNRIQLRGLRSLCAPAVPRLHTLRTCACSKRS